MTTPIPQPRSLPLIGNLREITREEIPIKSFESLVDIYGPVYKLALGKNDTYFVGGFEVFDELCDETRFFKKPPAQLVDDDAPDVPRGLFSAKSEKEPAWAQAHRILMPAFGPLAIADMFEEMHDIASQMVLKWARMGSGHRVLLTDDFTRRRSSSPSP